jgi:hypothetical protein
MTDLVMKPAVLKFHARCVAALPGSIDIAYDELAGVNASTLTHQVFDPVETFPRLRCVSFSTGKRGWPDAVD